MHRLKAEFKTRTVAGTSYEQWQYEVTGGGRIWYGIDDVQYILYLHTPVLLTRFARNKALGELENLLQHADVVRHGVVFKDVRASDRQMRETFEPQRLFLCGRKIDAEWLTGSTICELPDGDIAK
jgi:hypothetical protein